MIPGRLHAGQTAQKRTGLLVEAGLFVSCRYVLCCYAAGGADVVCRGVQGVRSGLAVSPDYGKRGESVFLIVIVPVQFLKIFILHLIINALQ